MFRYQYGTGYIGYIFGLFAAAILFKIALAIGPAYWDDHVIDQQITAVLQQRNTAMSPSQFSSKVNTFLAMNHLKDIDFNDIAKVSGDGQLQVQKHYEVRKHLFLNVDLILTFEKSFDQRTIKAE
ncbi:MAG: DUF4845 domain-containing protein [Acinetobacter sp.]